MKYKLLILPLSFVLYVSGQDLPLSPKPGECYVRCKTPDVYETKTEKILVKPSYSIITTKPATFKQVSEKVMIKAPEKVYRIQPTQWGKETVKYVKKAAAYQLKITPATFRESEIKIQVKPAFSRWEKGPAPLDCDASDPDDCETWCYKSYPAEFQTIPTWKIDQEANTEKINGKENYATYSKKVVLQEAKIIQEEIPAQYATITKTIIDQEAQKIVKIVPPIYETVRKEVLVEKGKLIFKKVECKLVEFQILPINWEYNDARLTSEAKSIIDSKLLPVLKANKGVKVEIASHTDSRGNRQYNQELSERRAKSVARYLESKGINNSLLVANGYGETRLKNRCADGVSCTEREHAINRRTEFRLIQ